MTWDRPLRVFSIHLGAYVVVVGLLAALNLTRNPNHLWFVWVAAGWGIGVAAHGLALLLKRSDRREPMFSDPRMRRLCIHTFVYVLVNVVLIAVNLIYSPGHYWFVYPLLGWGLALAIQALVVFRRRHQNR